MNHDIRQIIEEGENSLVEFKETSVSPQTLAEEIFGTSSREELLRLFQNARVF